MGSSMKFPVGCIRILLLFLSLFKSFRIISLILGLLLLIFHMYDLLLSFRLSFSPSSFCPSFLYFRQWLNEKFCVYISY